MTNEPRASVAQSVKLNAADYDEFHQNLLQNFSQEFSIGVEESMMDSNKKIATVCACCSKFLTYQ